MDETVKITIPCSNCHGHGCLSGYFHRDKVCEVCIKELKEDLFLYNKLIKSGCQRRISLTAPVGCGHHYCIHSLVMKYGKEYCSMRCSLQ